MKKILLVLTAVALFIGAFTNNIQAATSDFDAAGLKQFMANKSKVKNAALPKLESQQTGKIINGYCFSVSLPNDSVVTSFPIARQTIMNAFALLAVPTNVFEATKTRLNDPNAVEFKNAFDAGDLITVNTSTTNHIWRGNINPTNVNYAGQLGNRLYTVALFVATNGNKLMLNGVSCAVIDAKGYMSHSSALNYAQYPDQYNYSTEGLIAGPSGNPFANDHQIVPNNSTNTTLVDAIIWIGERVGLSVRNQTEIDQVNAYISSGGSTNDTIRYIYSYQDGTNIDTFGKDVVVYPLGQIPDSYYGANLSGITMKTPLGLLYSLVQPEGWTYSIWSTMSHDCKGPWSFVKSDATSGFSYNWIFGQYSLLKIVNNTNVVSGPSPDN